MVLGVVIPSFYTKTLHPVQGPLPIPRIQVLKHDLYRRRAFAAVVEMQSGSQDDPGSGFIENATSI